MTYEVPRRDLGCRWEGEEGSRDQHREGESPSPLPNPSLLVLEDLDTNTLANIPF